MKQISLADRLRGSEAERVRAVEAFRRAEAELGEERGRINDLLREARRALEDEEQDYTLVLKKVAEAYAEKAKRQAIAREPSEREFELAEELRQAQAWLDQLEVELSRCEGDYPSRVKVVFQQGADLKGQPQLQEEGVFTGSVKNRKAESGYSEYTGQKMLFVCRQNCGWLEEQPRTGQTWICSLAFQIGVDRGGRPIVMVNPQISVDKESEFRGDMVRLQQELEAERERVQPFDENGKPQTAMARALREARLV